MNFMKYILPLVLIILIASCRSTRKISTAIGSRDSATVILNPMESDSAKKVVATMDSIRNGKIDFETFSSKIKFDYEGKDRTLKDLNAFIRMRKDSAIWFSITGLLGAEGFRVLITPEKVSILDKLNRTVQHRDFDYLREVAKLPVDFGALQDLLIGNPIFLDSNIVAYSSSESAISLTTVGSIFKNFSSFALPDLNLQRTKLDDVDIVSNRSADLFYDGYSQSGDISFPLRRKISIADKNRINIDIEFRQVSFNTPVSFPFSVPENYTVK